MKEDRSRDLFLQVLADISVHLIDDGGNNVDEGLAIKKVVSGTRQIKM